MKIAPFVELALEESQVTMDEFMDFFCSFLTCCLMCRNLDRARHLLDTVPPSIRSAPQFASLEEVLGVVSKNDFRAVFSPLQSWSDAYASSSPLTALCVLKLNAVTITKCYEQIRDMFSVISLANLAESVCSTVDVVQTGGLVLVSL